MGFWVIWNLKLLALCRHLVICCALLSWPNNSQISSVKLLYFLKKNIRLGDWQNAQKFFPDFSVTLPAINFQMSFPVLKKKKKTVNQFVYREEMCPAMFDDMRWVMESRSWTWQQDGAVAHCNSNNWVASRKYTSFNWSIAVALQKPRSECDGLLHSESAANSSAIPASFHCRHRFLEAELNWRLECNSSWYYPHCYCFVVTTLKTLCWAFRHALRTFAMTIQLVYNRYTNIFQIYRFFTGHFVFLNAKKNT